MPILEVKKIGGEAGTADERLIKLREPVMWGSSDFNERLKSTCH